MKKQKNLKVGVLLALRALSATRRRAWLMLAAVMLLGAADAVAQPPPERVQRKQAERQAKTLRIEAAVQRLTARAAAANLAARTSLEQRSGLLGQRLSEEQRDRLGDVAKAQADHRDLAEFKAAQAQVALAAHRGERSVTITLSNQTRGPLPLGYAARIISEARRYQLGADHRWPKAPRFGLGPYSPPAPPAP